MDFNPEIPTVDPNAATDMHPLDYLQQLASQANQAPMPNVPSLPQAKPTETSGDGWRGLLHMFAPVIGALAVGGGGPKQTGFMNGYSEGQQAVEADKQRKAQEAQRKSAIASDFMLRISDQAQNITDPVAFQKFADLADAAFVKAGYGQPGEIKNQLSFNTSSLAKKQLKELTDHLDSLGKSGYSLDDLASSGAVLKLSTGQSVPIGVAMDVTRARPLTGGGQPIAKPMKAAATAEERFLQKWAKENGLKVEDLTSAQELEARKAYAGAGRSDTPPAGSDFNQFLKRWAKDNNKTVDQITSADEMKARKAYNDSTKDPQLTDINLSLKQLQLENEKNKAKAGAGGYEVKPGSRDERIAQQLSTGDLTFSDFNRLLGARSAATIDRKLALYDKAMELNPDFTPAKFELGYKFASNQGTQMATVALNRVEPNVDKLIALSDAWDRTKYPTVNSFLRGVGFQWGDKRITDFGQLQTIVGDELGPALGVGQATDLKTKLGLEMAGGNKGADSFKSGMLLVKEALSNQRKALNDQKGQYGDKTPKPQASTPLKVGGFTVEEK